MTKYNEKLLKKLFGNKEFIEFSNMMLDMEDKIDKVDTSAICNYDHNILQICDEEEFVTTYKCLKFYLDKINSYSPKMREGLALCATKAAIIDEYCPVRIDNYLCVGDKFSGCDRLNPFEEICRLLLIVVKNERYSNNFGEVVDILGTRNDLEKESKLFLHVASASLDEFLLRKKISCFSTDDVITGICDELEKSNISSTDPIGATKKENRDVLINQFDRVYDLYNSKLKYRMLIGDCMTTSLSDKLLTRFDNRITYAKRNIGIYEKTKQLIK